VKKGKESAYTHLLGGGVGGNGMIDPKEFIRGEYLPHLCDLRVGTENNLPYEEQLILPDNRHISVYAKAERVQAAHVLIARNPERIFTLVTHNSDMTINTCTMPGNLVRWFAQNRNTDQSRIYSIPIGLENEYWFPYKQNVMLAATKEERVIQSFVQFSRATHSERNHALNILRPEIYDMHVGANGDRDQHALFCQNLKRYAFCICPRGNGIDTHRVWECLYMGCIPICKKYHAHQFDQELPILFVDEWSDITPELLHETYHSIDGSLFDSDILKMSYWAEKINKECE
jgi:hypothetical protein